MNPDAPLGFFQTLLAALQTAFLPGIALMQPLVMVLSGVLIVLDLVRLGTGFVLGMGRAWDGVAWLGLLVARTYVIAEWPQLMTMVAEAFVQLGLHAGGEAITPAQFLDPGAYLQIGFQTAQVLYTQYTARVSIAGIFTGSVLDAILYVGAWLGMLAAYVLMAFHIFMIQMEMTLAVVIGYPFLAFMHSRHTAWIARGAIAYPINQGVAFLTLAFLAAVLFRFLGTPQVTNPGVQASVVMALGAWAMAILFIKARKLASGIITGQPTLTAGTLVGALVAGVGAATLGTTAAVGAGRMALGGASRASAGIQGAYAAYQAGGMRGMVVAGGQAVGGGLRQITAPARAALAGTYHQRTQQPSAQQGARYAGWQRQMAARSTLSYLNDEDAGGIRT